jgi:hypothetical protein
MGIRLFDGDFYYHTMWGQGFGGKIFRQIGTTSAGSPIFLPLLYRSR